MTYSNTGTIARVAEIISYLKEEGRAQRKDIIANTSAKNPDHILKELEKQNLITKSKRGIWEHEDFEPTEQNIIELMRDILSEYASSLRKRMVQALRDENNDSQIDDEAIVQEIQEKYGEEYGEYIEKSKVEEYYYKNKRTVLNELCSEATERNRKSREKTKKAFLEKVE